MSTYSFRSDQLGRRLGFQIGCGQAREKAAKIFEILRNDSFCFLMMFGRKLILVSVLNQLLSIQEIEYLYGLFVTQVIHLFYIR